MSNDYAEMMRKGIKLPPEAKVPRIGVGKASGGNRLAPYVPTDNAREAVRILSANGVSEPVMAKLLHISKSTLFKYFKVEIRDGRDMITAKMGAALVKEGLAGNVAAQRYWLGTHGGEAWRIPKNSDLNPDIFDSEQSRHPVQFYMPSNGRDEPEDLGPIIDMTIEDAA